MTRREGAPEPAIAADRRRLLTHLDRLEAAEARIPCRTGDAHTTAPWTSDIPEDQQAAARACGACPARTECRLFGLAWPDLPGVYGGLTERDRARGRTTKTKEKNR